MYVTDIVGKSKIRLLSASSMPVSICTNHVDMLGRLLQVSTVYGLLNNLLMTKMQIFVWI